MACRAEDAVQDIGRHALGIAVSDGRDPRS